MERISVLVTSSPGSVAAQRAFQLVRSLAARGGQVSLCLLEDGVYAATGAAPFGDCAAVLALAPDLNLRGISESDLDPACRPVSHGDVIDLVMTGSDRTLGTF